ncbi:MAG: methyltransferase domain-containing protein [candidate division Zixibacteria bacterium]|nr:methyltransferase domain-containing protein [candidate division Zixibacteria bacterium]
MNYDSYYKTAAANFNSNRLDGYDEVEEHCSWFVRNLDSGTTRTLLDIGCGTGRYTHSFANKGLLAIGIDRSPHQIEVASRKVPALNADALNLPFPSHAFDVISAIMMLHQIDSCELEVLFDNIDEVLRKHGSIWIKTCSLADLERRPFNDYFPTALEVNASRYPTIRKLLNTVQYHDFYCSRQTNKCNQYSILGSDLLSRFREKHNTTLHMLPENEFEIGMAMMEERFDPREQYSFQHYHTLIELTRC